MGVFRTEKEIEAWLETETRLLSLPDGTKKPLTGFRLLWAAYDDILKAGGYTHEKLMGWTLGEAKLQKISFEDAFQCVIVYIDRRIRRRGAPRA